MIFFLFHISWGFVLIISLLFLQYPFKPYIYNTYVCQELVELKKKRCNFVYLVEFYIYIQLCVGQLLTSHAFNDFPYSNNVSEESPRIGLFNQHYAVIGGIVAGAILVMTVIGLIIFVGRR